MNAVLEQGYMHQAWQNCDRFR